MTMTSFPHVMRNGLYIRRCFSRLGFHWFAGHCRRAAQLSGFFTGVYAGVLPGSTNMPAPRRHVNCQRFLSISI